MSADPVSLSLLAMSAAKGIGQMQAEARAARHAARAHEARAEAEREGAGELAREQRRRNRQALGRQRTRVARSGVRLEGSPLAVQSDLAALGELDALAIERAGDAAAARELTEAARLRARQRADLNARLLGAGRTLLTGMGRKPSGWPVLS